MLTSLKIILVFLITQMATALAFDYQLKGAYKLNSSMLKFIQYDLKWSEENGSIKGQYRDDYFTRNAPVTGEVSNSGRTFNVSLPKSAHGTKSIVLVTARTSDKDTGTSVPIVVITRDAKGGPLTNTDTYSQFMETKIQAQEESSCREGFGDVAGFCGLYAGAIVEEEDRNNLCDLLFADAARLELKDSAELVLYLGDVNDLVITPRHEIGRLRINPASTTIEVSGKNCGPLEQIKFPTKNCKRQTLEGTFYLEGGVANFTGTYTIRDEKTKNRCRYSITMERR